MVGAVSVFEEEDITWLGTRLRERIAVCGIKSWDEMRDILGSLIWIPLVQEKRGRIYSILYLGLRSEKEI